MLDLSKLEAGKIVLSPEPTLLHPLIKEVVDTSYPLAYKNNNQFTFDTNALPTSTKCVIDPLRLRQILLNLISNACKFTEDGTVSLTARLNEAEQTLHFIVTDDGIGMSSEQQTKLFQPFTQADAKTASRYGGTGLGLYLSRELCILMQGDIHIESVLNEGASFEVILPLVQVTVDQTTSSHSK